MLLQGMVCNVSDDVRLSDARGQHEVQLVSMTSCRKPHHRHWICRECNPRQWQRNRRTLLLGPSKRVAGQAAAASPVRAHDGVPIMLHPSTLVPCASMKLGKNTKHKSLRASCL